MIRSYLLTNFSVRYDEMALKILCNSLITYIWNPFKIRAVVSLSSLPIARIIATKTHVLMGVKEGNAKICFKTQLIWNCQYKCQKGQIHFDSSTHNRIVFLIYRLNRYSVCPVLLVHEDAILTRQCASCANDIVHQCLISSRIKCLCRLHCIE